MSVDVRGLVVVGTRTPDADAVSAMVGDGLGLPRPAGDGLARFDLPEASFAVVQQR